MSLVKCIKCDKEFYVKPNRVKRGWGKYCSNECKHNGFKTGKLIACTFCGKVSYKNLKDQKRSKSGNFFCSKSCQTKWRNSNIYIGANHGNWINGEKSYRDILKRSNALQKCAKCETDDKRILAVHHKDKNRKNNELLNLAWLCHNCHYLVHHYADEGKGFLV